MTSERKHSLDTLDSQERGALRLLMSTGTVPQITLLVKLIRLGLVVKEEGQFKPAPDLTDRGHPAVKKNVDVRVSEDWPAQEEEERHG